MGSHPINLAFRFLLELSALVAMGFWGWTKGTGALRYLLAIAIPASAAALWGTLAVPDDPSRSGKAPVPVPGPVRLALELAFLIFATWSLLNTGANWFGWILGMAVLVHYVLSYDRLWWLIRQ